MNRIALHLLALTALLGSVASADHHRPFAPAPGEPESTALPMDDPSIVSWADEVVAFVPGENVAEDWQVLARALGPAEGNAFDVYVLGSGGSITLSFPGGLRDGDGADFAVFENSFDDWFLELAFIEVSSDDETFFRFPATSLTEEPVGGFGRVDPRKVDGLAGKYRQGFGTPFDLADLAAWLDETWDAEETGQPWDELLDLERVTAVRIVDIIGDGRSADAHGNPIYDPYPTDVTAGFDLDAVAVIHPSWEEPADAYLAWRGERYPDTWRYHRVLGFYWIGLWPWVWVEGQGFWYVAEETAPEWWFFDSELGWIYTDVTVYPWFLQMPQNRWLKFQIPGEDDLPARARTFVDGEGNTLRVPYSFSGDGGGGPGGGDDLVPPER